MQEIIHMCSKAAKYYSDELKRLHYDLLTERHLYKKSRYTHVDLNEVVAEIEKEHQVRIDPDAKAEFFAVAKAFRKAEAK